MKEQEWNGKTRNSGEILNVVENCRNCINFVQEKVIELKVIENG